mmetsp:Transcript_160/g.235  ORF Transcript_160/g.235 Transcript_160/m.235 type:complete len:108 (+) Transcript_160:221-544(+)
MFSNSAMPFNNPFISLCAAMEVDTAMCITVSSPLYSMVSSSVSEFSWFCLEMRCCNNSNWALKCEGSTSSSSSVLGINSRMAIFRGGRFSSLFRYEKKRQSRFTTGM